MPSVVIPAHNEVAVIGNCLHSLLAEADPGEFETIVVCNGCTDGTADAARSFGGKVIVIETEVGSKPFALNLGDRAATSFPRLYVDADVEISTAGARALIAVLRSDVLAASPSLALDASVAGPGVRSYHRIWRELPLIRRGLVGRGVYAMSKEGRERFGEFPDLVADDLFVHRLFAPDEKAVVAAVESVVTLPRSLRDLIARKGRSKRGVDEMLRLMPNGRDGGRSNTAWLGVVRRQPRRLMDVPVYVFVTLAVRVEARRQEKRGAGWVGESGSRER